MKSKITAIALTGFIAASLVFWLSPPAAHASGTATISLTSSSYMVTNGSTLTVNVYEDSGGDTVNAVDADFTYPTSALTFQSITSSSGFNISAQSLGSGGSVKIGRGAMPAVSGNQLIATVFFTVTGTSGSFSLNFDQANTGLYRTDTGSESLTYQDANYTISAPAPPPTGGGSSGTSGGSSSSAPKSSTGTASKSTPLTTTPAPSSTSPTTTTPIALTVSDLYTDNLSANSATIHWTTNQPASSEVDYGTTTDYGFTDTDSDLTTAHAITLNAKNLAPGTYHFIVKSTDAAGQQAASDDMTFDTSSGSLKFTTAAASGSGGISKTVAAVSVGTIATAAVGGAFVIRRMHWRIFNKHGVVSNMVAPGTSVINGQVSVTAEPDQPESNNIVKPGGV